MTEGHDRQRHESTVQNETEEFWKSIQDHVRTDLASAFDADLARFQKPDSPSSRTEEKLDEMMAREEIFATSILSRVEQVLEERGSDSVLLLDIDDTIGMTRPSEEDPFALLLRPSLVPVLERVRSFGLKIGFISNRTKEDMELQLRDAGYLDSLRKYIAPEHIYSTREESRELSYHSVDELDSELKKVFGGEDGVIDDNVLGRDGKYPTATGDFEKLFFLKNMRDTIGEKAFIVVDDLDYPKFLDSKKGFYGVSLGKRGAFIRPSPLTSRESRA